jgi:TolA-binding protein
MRNRNILFIVLLMWMVAGCTNKQKSLEQSIKNIEQSDSATTTGGIDALNTLYLEYALEFPDAPKSSQYLHMAAMHAFLKKEFNASKDLSVQYIQRYPKGIELAPTFLNLGRIYIYGKDKPDSAIYYFKKAEEIRALTLTDLNELATAMDKKAALLQSSASADTYFEAANLFQKTGASVSAIQCLSKGVAQAPNHPKAAGALQTMGFIFENELSQKDSAVFYYNRLIREYPETGAAQQAKYLVKNSLVGKSAEEILEFGLKNKGKEK